MTWTFDGYWNAVIGAERTAGDVLVDFDMLDATRRDFDEWLGHAEESAREAGGLDTLPPEWEGYHERALAMLVEVGATEEG